MHCSEVQTLWERWVPLFCQSTNAAEETAGPRVSVGLVPAQPPMAVPVGLWVEQGTSRKQGKFPEEGMVSAAGRVTIYLSPTLCPATITSVLSAPRLDVYSHPT